jgi:N-acetylglucosaminyldiphosphoundecaprenol N-acetyl-beta-D-mannosaminyltransferase
MTQVPVRSLFGYPVLAVTSAQAVDLCDQAIRARRPFQIGVLNAAKVVNASRDATLHEALLTCDAIFADGQSVVWASRLLGQPLPERVTGIDLFQRLLQLADREGYSVYLLGATQEVLDKVVRVVAERYPHVRVGGYHDGYFDAEEAASIAEQIGASRVDMLFVAITSPMKETFIAKYQPVMKVPITHGVGGSFDIVAGKTKRAPLLWQRLGMEWAYRVVQEPRRMFMRYLRTNGSFVYMVGRDLITLQLKKSRLHQGG